MEVRLNKIQMQTEEKHNTCHDHIKTLLISLFVYELALEVIKHLRPSQQYPVSQ